MFLDSVFSATLYSHGSLRIKSALDLVVRFAFSELLGSLYNVSLECLLLLEAVCVWQLALHLHQGCVLLGEQPRWLCFRSTQRVHDSVYKQNRKSEMCPHFLFKMWWWGLFLLVFVFLFIYLRRRAMFQVFRHSPLTVGCVVVSFSQKERSQSRAE